MDIRKIKDNKYKSNELIESIFAFKREKCDGLSLVDTLIEYSFHYDIPIQEVGNVISEHSEFVSMLEKQLERDGYILKDKSKNDIELNEEEW